jgi:hypothetical protein
VRTCAVTTIEGATAGFDESECNDSEEDAAEQSDAQKDAKDKSACMLNGCSDVMLIVNIWVGGRGVCRSFVS